MNLLSKGNLRRSGGRKSEGEGVYLSFGQFAVCGSRNPVHVKAECTVSVWSSTAMCLELPSLKVIQVFIPKPLPQYL